VWLLAIVTEVGNGKNTLFWTDRWLLGQSLEQTLPHLFSSVAARARKKTVHASLSDGSWIAGIRGALTLQVLLEYLHLWELLSTVQLQPEVEDTHIWQFQLLVNIPQNQHMKHYLLGPPNLVLGKEFGRAGPLGNAIFFMWTAAHNRCWTAHRLARRGLPRPAAM
jgi:hypothetical protein